MPMQTVNATIKKRACAELLREALPRPKRWSAAGFSASRSRPSFETLIRFCSTLTLRFETQKSDLQLAWSDLTSFPLEQCVRNPDL